MIKRGITERVNTILYMISPDLISDSKVIKCEFHNQEQADWTLIRRLKLTIQKNILHKGWLLI